MKSCCNSQSATLSTVWRLWHAQASCQCCMSTQLLRRLVFAYLYGPTLCSQG